MISVIIPTYQHAKELPECLESVFKQTLKEMEVIVVNDGSTDDTDEVIKPFLGRINYIKQENRGGNAARNRGFDASKGELVIFLDADVVMRPDMLARMAEALKRFSDSSYAYSSFKFGWKKFRLWSFDAATLRRMNYIHTSSLIRREHFPRFDEAIRRLQDWDLWLTMLEQNHLGVWVPELLFRAVHHEGGISTWVPGSFYKIPWHWVGLRIKTIEKFRIAREIMVKKHQL